MGIIYEWKARKVSGKNIGIEGYNLTFPTNNATAEPKAIVTSTLGAAVNQARLWKDVNFEFDINEANIKKGTENGFDVIYRGACYHLHRIIIEVPEENNT